jgi:hypothetical protein
MRAKNQLDPNAVLIAIIIFVVIFIWSLMQRNKSEKLAEEALGGRKGEEVLAILDTKQNPPDPRDVKRYADLLNSISKRCLETQSEISVMAIVLTKSSIEAGYQDPNNFQANLESLRTISDISESMTDSNGRPGSGFCIPDIQEIITSNREAAAQNEQYQMQEQEEEAARQRQEERERNR